MAVGTVLGVLVVGGTWFNLLRTLVAYRSARKPVGGGLQRVVVAFYQRVARALPDYLQRDRWLAWASPTALISMLAGWLGSFLIGYAALLWAWSTLGTRAALREAGSSLFTLGFASSERDQLTVIDFAAAGTGPIVVGLLVGYLPALYASYNRREVDVAMLHSRAGEPNWGPEILARAAASQMVEGLPALFAQWERWAADVAESHANYPVLIHTRSSRPLRSWLVALVSVMDAAALDLAFRPSAPQAAARTCIRMGFVCLRDLADVEGVSYDPDPLPGAALDLTLAELEGTMGRLLRAGYPVERTAAEAWGDFAGWRVNYERVAYQLAAHVDAPPAPWTGPRNGRLAQLLPPTTIDRRPDDPTGTRALRDRRVAAVDQQIGPVADPIPVSKQPKRTAPPAAGRPDER